jgi:hypothetical protein
MKMKRIKDVTALKGDLVKLKQPNGTTALLNKFLALRYAQDASMDLYVEENNDVPLAEMRDPNKKTKR